MNKRDFTNKPDLIRVIDEVERYILNNTQRSPKRIEVLNLLRKLKEIDNSNLTPEAIAEFFIKSPDVGGAGLERLLAVDEKKFRQSVPQIYDAQTGLYNKIHFEKVLLPQSISKANKNQVPLSYLLLDLDKFHDFNEMYGYEKGHEAIDRFVNLLIHEFRTRVVEPIKEQRTTEDRRKQYADYFDYVTRMPDLYSLQGRVGGGEEFAVILYGANEADSLKAANRFLDTVRKIKIPYGYAQNLGISASGGISEYKQGMSTQELKGNAEKALKYAKSEGRNRISVFSQIPKS